MNVRAFLFALSAATVAISGAFGSIGHFHSSRRLQQTGGFASGGSTQCMIDCASLSSGQLECMEKCSDENPSNSVFTSATPGSTGTSRSVSCENGKCKVQECDPSGCRVSESDSDDIVGEPFSGVDSGTGGTSSSATVSASSGPGGVQTDVQTSGDGASGSASASNGTVTETTSCQGSDCETNTDGSTSDGGVQNSLGGGSTTSGDTGEVSGESEVQGEETAGSPPVRGQATTASARSLPRLGTLGSRRRKPRNRSRNRGFRAGRVVSRSTSCSNGVCTTTECTANGKCSVRKGGKRPSQRGRGRGPPPNTPQALGRVVSRSRTCSNGVCTTRACDARGNCRTTSDAPPGPRRPPPPSPPPPTTPAKPPPARPSRPSAPVAPQSSPARERNPIGRIVSRSRSCSNGVCTTLECDAQGNCRTEGDSPPADDATPVDPPSRPAAPTGPPPPDDDAIGRIVSRSTSCSNGVCTTQACDAQGNCRTSTRRLQNDDDAAATDPPGSPDAPTVSGPPAGDAIGRIVSRSRSCSNGVCTTLECDAQGNCRTEGDSPPADDAPPGNPPAPPTTPEVSPEASPSPPSSPPPNGAAIGPIVSSSSSCNNGVCRTRECDAQGNCRTTGDAPPEGAPVGRIVSRSRSCSNGVCTILECDSQGNCRTASDVPPEDDVTPVAPQSRPAAPTSPPPPDGDTIGRIVSRSRSCNNGVCTTRECDAQGNCRTTGDAPPEGAPVGRIVSRSRVCGNGVCTTQECDAQGNCRTSDEEPAAQNAPVGQPSPPDQPVSPTVSPVSPPEEPVGPLEAPAAPPAPAGDPIGRIVSRSSSCSNGVCTTQECDARGNCRTSGSTPPSREPVGRIVSRSRSCSNGVCTTQECDAQGNCRSSEDPAGVRSPVGGQPAGPTPRRFRAVSGVRGTVTASANGTSTDIQTFGSSARANATASNGNVTQTTTCTGGDCETAVTQVPRAVALPPGPAASIPPLPPVAVDPLILETAEEPGMGPEADAEAPGPGLEVSDVEAPGPAGEAPTDVAGTPQVVVRGGALGSSGDLAAQSAGADAELDDDSAAGGLVRGGRAVAAAILSIALLAAA